MRIERAFKVVVSILLAMALILSFTACGKPAEKKQEESFDAAYSKKIDSLISAVDSLSKAAQNTTIENKAAEVKIGVELSDSLHSLLRSYTSYDLKWINEAEIIVSENYKDDIMALTLGLAYGQTDIIAVDAIMNLAAGEMILGAPVLNDIYLKQSLGDETTGASVGAMGDFTKMIPDSKVLGELIREIYKIVIAEIGTVSGEKTELDVNGVKQACTVYEIKLSQKEVAQISLAVLAGLKGSKNLEKIICDFVDSTNEMSEDVNGTDTGYTAKEAYDEAIDSLNDEIESIKEDIKFDTFTDSTALVWTSYVGAGNEVIGIEMDFADDDYITTVFLATAKNGNKGGTQIYVKQYGEKLFEIIGELIDDGKKMSGTYEIEIEGQSMAFIDLENVDTKKLENGYFVGSISLSPSKGLINMITEGADVDLSAVGLAIASVSLRVDVEKNDGEEIKAAISIMNGTEPYASLKIESVISDNEDVSVPNNTTEDPNQWAAGIDFDQLISNVKKSGLPTYIVEIVESLQYMMQYN